MVNPTSLLFGGRPTARDAHEMRGNGMLEKANAEKYSWPLNPLWSGAEWNSRIPLCTAPQRIQWPGIFFGVGFLQHSVAPHLVSVPCGRPSSEEERCWVYHVPLEQR